MAFINALAWLAMIVCAFMAGMRFWGLMDLSYTENRMVGSEYAHSVLRFFLGGIVAALWIIFG